MNTLHFNAKDLDPFAIGFGQMYDTLNKVNEQIGTVVPSYPPYNILQTGENTYTIELAVAGFSKDDIDITIEDDVLTVKGKTNAVDNEDDDLAEYLHKGISNRDFKRKFTIADQIEVAGAEMDNGLLKVFLENIVPDHKKPRNVKVK